MMNLGIRISESIKPKSLLKYISCITAFASAFLFAQTVYAAGEPPQGNVPSPNDVMSDYPAGGPVKKPGEVKHITIINNTAHTIYPVFRAYSTKDKHEYRIYVGYLDENKQQHYGIPAGIPGSDIVQHNKVVVALPKQLWDAARIEVFTHLPAIPLVDSDPTAKYAVDEIPGSVNNGDLIYRNDHALGFPLDDHSQLAEYTIETNADGSDRHTVDYDISYVDEIYMPMALEVDTGTMGYMGTGMSMDEMQKDLQELTDGAYTRGYFTRDRKGALGWPSFNMKATEGYDAKYIKIPAAYNIFALSDSRTTYDQSKYMLKTNLSSKNGGDEAVTNGVVNHWLAWINGYNGVMPVGPALTAGSYAKLCKKDKNPEFCENFAETANYVWSSAHTAFPALTPAKLVQKILGYDFSASFNPYNPDIDPAKFNSPNAFRDSVKSLLRGVPYPFWNYDAATDWYPSPNASDDGIANSAQKYNLDPIVWFVHKKLQMAGYGFSIDDDTGNVEAPGDGFIMAVGSLEGLPNHSQYEASTQQAILLAPGWADLKSNNLGDCHLNKNTGTNCPVSLSPQSFPSATVNLTAPNDEGTLSFTVHYGAKTDKGVYPVLMNPEDCKVTGKLSSDSCSGLLPDPNKPQFFIIPPPSSSGPGPTPPAPPPPSGGGKATAYLAPGWGSVSSKDCTLEESKVKDIGGNPIAFSFGSDAEQCTLNFAGSGQSSDVEADITVKFNEDKKPESVTCKVNGGDCKAQPVVNPSADAVNMPTPDGVAYGR